MSQHRLEIRDPSLSDSELLAGLETLIRALLGLRPGWGAIPWLLGFAEGSGPWVQEQALRIMANRGPVEVTPTEILQHLDREHEWLDDAQIRIPGTNVTIGVCDSGMLYVKSDDMTFLRIDPNLGLVAQGFILIAVLVFGSWIQIRRSRR